MRASRGVLLLLVLMVAAGAAVAHYRNAGGTALTGTGVVTHGFVMWGSTAATLDTGTEVCAARGMTCLDASALGGVVTVTCATVHAARFTAFCY